MGGANKDERTIPEQQRAGVRKDPEIKQIKMRGNTNERETRYGRFDFILTLPDHEVDMWKKIANEQEPDRSALIRAFATVGRRCLQEYDPLEENDNAEPATTEDLVKQNVPQNKDSAETIDEITNSIFDDLEQIVIQTLAEDGQIQQNGEQFYRVQE